MTKSRLIPMLSLIFLLASLPALKAKEEEAPRNIYQWNMQNNDILRRLRNRVGNLAFDEKKKGVTFYLLIDPTSKCKTFVAEIEKTIHEMFKDFPEENITVSIWKMQHKNGAVQCGEDISLAKSKDKFDMSGKITKAFEKCVSNLDDNFKSWAKGLDCIAKELKGNSGPIEILLVTDMNADVDFEGTDKVIAALKSKKARLNVITNCGLFQNSSNDMATSREFANAKGEIVLPAGCFIRSTESAFPEFFDVNFGLKKSGLASAYGPWGLANAVYELNGDYYFGDFNANNGKPANGGGKAPDFKKIQELIPFYGSEKEYVKKDLNNNYAKAVMQAYAQTKGLLEISNYEAGNDGYKKNYPNYAFSTYMFNPLASANATNMKAVDKGLGILEKALEQAKKNPDEDKRWQANAGLFYLQLLAIKINLVNRDAVFGNITLKANDIRLNRNMQNLDSWLKKPITVNVGKDLVTNGDVELSKSWKEDHEKSGGGIFIEADEVKSLLDQFKTYKDEFAKQYAGTPYEWSLDRFQICYWYTYKVPPPNPNPVISNPGYKPPPPPTGRPSTGGGIGSGDPPTSGK